MAANTGRSSKRKKKIDGAVHDFAGLRMRRTMALQGARAEAALRAHRPASREATFVLGAKDDLQYTPSPSKVVSVHIACFPTARKGPRRIHKKIAAIASLILSRATLHLPPPLLNIPHSVFTTHVSYAGRNDPGKLRPLQSACRGQKRSPAATRTP